MMTISALLASAVDRVALATFIKPTLRAAGRTIVEHEHFVVDPALFWAPPTKRKPITLSPVRARTFDATWSSSEPFDQHLAATYASHAANRVASARLFLHDEPAKAAVLLVHGYLGGRYAFEERVWPIRRWFERGFDVALFTLPFHGVRALADAHPFKKAPPFPSADPRFTNEGIRQAINDLRALIRFFSVTRGTTRIGAMGMSLGGYTVALLATLERLDFVVPIVPLADLTDFARGDLPCGAELGHSPAHHVISPFARESRVDRDRVLVIGADQDEIAPLVHARALAEHFNAPLETFHGGHVLQIGRANAFRKIERLLVP